MPYNYSSYTSPSGRYSSTNSSYSSGSGLGNLSSIGSSLSGRGGDRYGGDRYGGVSDSVTRSYNSNRYESSYDSPRRYTDYSSPRSYGTSDYSSRYSDRDYSTSSYTPRSTNTDYSGKYSSKYKSTSALDSDYTPRRRYDPDDYKPRTKTSYDDDEYKPRKKTTFEDDDYQPRTKTSSKKETSDESTGDSSRARRRREERKAEREREEKQAKAADTEEVKETEVSASSASKTANAPKPFVPPSGGATKTEMPCGDQTATRSKSSYNQAPVDPAKIPICSHCNSAIRGPFVLALNKSWCPNHFTCAKCDSELVNMGFVELNGKIYCENDYEHFFAPKCAKCTKAIVGDTVNALDKTWHPLCFVCTECGGPISSGAFHVEDGKPYCMNDWQKLFQTKCTGCSFPVEPGDRWIEALDANWHSECFVCNVCNTPLEGKPFYPRDGKPYCKGHAGAA